MSPREYVDHAYRRESRQYRSVMTGLAERAASEMRTGKYRSVEYGVWEDDDFLTQMRYRPHSGAERIVRGRIQRQ